MFRQITYHCKKYLAGFQIRVGISTLLILLPGSADRLHAQNIVPLCDSYKNPEAATHKIKTIKVYDEGRKRKVAQYEFDVEGYLLRADTLLHVYDTYPSQTRCIHYSKDRSLVIDSIINVSKEMRVDVPVNTVRIRTIQCVPGNTEIRELQYDLIRKYPTTHLYHFNSEGKCDTIYTTDFGKKYPGSYFTHNLGYSNDVILIKKSTPAYQRYEEYRFDAKSKQLIYYDDRITENNFTYNTEGLLTEQTSYYHPPFSMNMYADGKHYDSIRIIYTYKGNKLLKETKYGCNRIIQSSRTIVFEQVGKAYTTHYEYTSTGLLLRIKRPEKLHSLLSTNFISKETRSTILV